MLSSFKKDFFGNSFNRTTYIVRRDTSEFFRNQIPFLRSGKETGTLSADTRYTNQKPHELPTPGDHIQSHTGTRKRIIKKLQPKHRKDHTLRKICPNPQFLVFKPGTLPNSSSEVYTSLINKTEQKKALPKS